MQVNTYKIEKEHGEASVTFLPEDPLFRGHFEEEPILPGVALIDAVVVLVSRAMGKTMRLKKLSYVKFFQIVKPGQPIQLSFDWSQKEGYVKVQARWDFSAEQKVAALSCEVVEVLT
jgi:3-hydroxymyristoyl/3-hydroxydecanoyl-(acyl carrier protein) dehydratase